MSYWAGNDGENPMRYAGGLAGGSWLSLLASDLGAGKFDGAHLVQNFENLNPGNAYWDKYYHLWDNIDTEPERFLDFERWWSGFYLMIAIRYWGPLKRHSMGSSHPFWSDRKRRSGPWPRWSKSTWRPTESSLLSIATLRPTKQ